MCTTSVPVLDEAVPTSSGDLGRFVRVPQRCDAHVVMSLPLLKQLRRLPIPNEEAPVGVARDEIAVGDKARYHPENN